MSMLALEIIDGLVNLIDYHLIKQANLVKKILISSDGVTTMNKEEIISKNIKAKPHKIELYKNIQSILDQHSVCYWLDCGSLLGAFRDNKMIPHDWDIDIAVFHNKSLNVLYEIIKHELKLINKDYCVEYQNDGGAVHVSLPNIGFRTFNTSSTAWSDGEQYPSVWLDIYQYKEDHDHNFLLHHYNDLGLKKHSKNDILPLNKILFEGILSFIPNNAETYLKTLYGYIGKDCQWDEKSGKYVKLTL
eukprot:152852_1